MSAILARLARLLKPRRIPTTSELLAMPKAEQIKALQAMTDEERDCVTVQAMVNALNEQTRDDESH